MVQNPDGRLRDGENQYRRGHAGKTNRGHDQQGWRLRLAAPRSQQGRHRQQDGESQRQQPKPEAEGPAQKSGDAPGVSPPGNQQVVQIRGGKTIAARRNRRISVPIGQRLHALLGHEHCQGILVHEVGRHLPFPKPPRQLCGIVAQGRIAGQEVVGRKRRHHHMREYRRQRLVHRAVARHQFRAVVVLGTRQGKGQHATRPQRPMSLGEALPGEQPTRKQGRRLGRAQQNNVPGRTFVPAKKIAHIADDYVDPGIAQPLAGGGVSGLDLHLGHGRLRFCHRHVDDWMLENLGQEAAHSACDKDPPRLAHLQQGQMRKFFGRLALGQHQGQMAVLVQGSLLGAEKHGHMAVAGVCTRLDGFPGPAPGQATRLDSAQPTLAQDGNRGQPDRRQDPRAAGEKGRSQHRTHAQPCGHRERLPGLHQPGRGHPAQKPTCCLAQVGALRGNARQATGQGELAPPSKQNGARVSSSPSPCSSRLSRAPGASEKTRGSPRAVSSAAKSAGPSKSAPTTKN